MLSNNGTKEENDKDKVCGNYRAKFKTILKSFFSRSIIFFHWLWVCGSSAKKQKL